MMQQLYIIYVVHRTSGVYGEMGRRRDKV